MKKTANYAFASRYGTGGVWGTGSKQVIIEDRDTWESLVKVAAIWKTPASPEEVRKIIREREPSINDEVFERCWDIIKKTDSLIADGVYDPENRFSRNYLYYNYMGQEPASVHEKISNAAVTIIGCGGIGNHLSYLLATSGVKEIHLVDDDVIEISNLTRQVLFTESDIGLKKGEVLKRELLKRNSEAEIVLHDLSIKELNDFSKIPRSDLFIISADYPHMLMDWANEYCVRYVQPYVNVGYINDISVVGPFYIPGETSCYRCMSVIPDFETDDDINYYLNALHKDSKIATFPGVNGVAASYAFGDVIKFIGGFGEVLSKNKRIGIHSSTIKLEEQLIPLNKSCNVCSMNE